MIPPFGKWGFSIEFDLSVETAHRRGDSITQRDLHRIGGARHGAGQRLGLLLRHGIEQIVYVRILAPRATDADADAREPLAAERFDDRLDAVMAAGPTARADTQAPDGQIEIVVDDEKFVRLETQVT